jgi:hypothetical protein
MTSSTQGYALTRPQRPPNWLNPQKLGATELREISKDRIRVIDNGRKGLIEFFAGARPEDFVSWDAFVVNRSDKTGSYVYSNEQFWLAAAAAVKSRQFKLWINRDVYRGLKYLDVKNVKFRNILAEAELWRRGRALDLSRAGPKSKDALGEFFDVHESSKCIQCPPDQKPDQPALTFDPAQEIHTAHVPNTTRLGRELSSVLKRYAGGAASLKTAEEQGASGDKIPASLLQRFPHMRVDPSGPLPPGASFEVSVFANTTPPEASEKVEPLIINAPPEIKVFDVTVWLLGTPHFEITGPNPKSITITRDDADSTTGTFQVHVRDDILDPAPPRLTALFQYNHRPCGSVRRDIDLGHKSSDPIRAGVGTADPRMEIEPSAEPADIVVTVSNPTPDGLVYDCIVTTPHLPKFRDGHKEEWRPGGTTEKVVDRYFKFFTAPGLSDDLRVANLTGAGVQLFDKVAPAHFKEAFWALLDGGHPLRSISIVSIEPFTPWELMVPNRRKPVGPPEQRRALGVEFAVGRWISSDYRSSRQRITLSDSLVFAPIYSEKKGPAPLAHSAEECEFVRKEFPGKSIAPADFTGFERAMAAGARSLIHFICHGKSAEAGEPTIYAQDGTPVPSFAFTGGKTTPAAIAKRKPFVFMNACEGGRTVPNMVGVGGFAPTFIELGASCVVAPLWSVKDTFAHVVAEEFYRQVKSEPGKPFAAILASIRAQAYKADGAEDTYAAYCFYGDPLATQYT